jgi:hypothetical protein
LGHLFLLQAGNMGSSWRWEGAWAALAKSSLVAFSSVPWMQEALMDLGWTRGFLVGNHPKCEEKPWKNLRKPLENHGTPQHVVVSLHFFWGETSELVVNHHYYRRMPFGGLSLVEHLGLCDAGGGHQILDRIVIQTDPKHIWNILGNWEKQLFK